MKNTEPHRIQRGSGQPVQKAAIWALLFLLCGLMLSGVVSSRFHPDESEWIYTTRYLALARRGIFSGPEWSGFYAIDEQPLARYLMGLAQKGAGFDLLHLNGPWNWSKSAGENRPARQHADARRCCSGRGWRWQSRPAAPSS